MLLADALELAKGMIATRSKHYLYNRTTQLRALYKALITGENSELLLKRFIKREDDAAFQQRLDLTISITPAVCSALSKPFNKVARNNKVKMNFDFNTKTRNEVVKKMSDSFYGKKKSANRGLAYWLKTRYTALQFVDPNAFVVIEWDAPESQAQIINPRPFEVTSDDAWNWEELNEELKWLWVHHDICFKKLLKKEKQTIAQAVAAGIIEDCAGDRFTLYEEDYTLVFTEIDPNYLRTISYVKDVKSKETFWKDSATQKTYSVRLYEPKLGYAPAYRVGYVRDQQTDGETMVNAWHEAMPYLMKSVKTVSEMDLTMALHAFPQKQQYVQRCPGVDKHHRCDMGLDTDGSVCKACSGVGFKVHTTAQDALYYPFPESGTTNAEVLDLEKMINYKAPPIDLLTFQKNYIDSLKNDCHYAVFVQTNLTRTAGTAAGGSGGSTPPKTATETNINDESVYDAIMPFTEKWSEVFIFSIDTFGRLAGTPVDEEVTITCVFPSDLKWKSMNELLTDLKTARDAGAPPFVIDKINNDIAEILYAGDEVAHLMYETKHKFYPFNGQSSDEIALSMASQYVSMFTKILYSNYEAIFCDIEQEHPDFWFMDYEQQWAILEAMVELYEQELQTNSIPDLGMMGDTPQADAPADETTVTA